MFSSISEKWNSGVLKIYYIQVCLKFFDNICWIIISYELFKLNQKFFIDIAKLLWWLQGWNEKLNQYVLTVCYFWQGCASWLRLWDNSLKFWWFVLWSMWFLGVMRLLDKVRHYYYFSASVTEDRFGHFLLHATEPVVWVSSISDLISVVIYFNITSNQARKSRGLPYTVSQQNCYPPVELFFIDESLGLSRAPCIYPRFFIVFSLP